MKNHTRLLSTILITALGLTAIPAPVCASEAVALVPDEVPVEVVEADVPVEVPVEVVEADVPVEVPVEMVEADVPAEVPVEVVEADAAAEETESEIILPSEEITPGDVMNAGLTPVDTFSPEISFRADALQKHSVVYMGHAAYGYTWNQAGEWIVLDASKTNTGSNNSKFLLSRDVVGNSGSSQIEFDKSYPYSNAWQGSDAREWCDTFLRNCFDEGERGAILPVSKTDSAYTIRYEKDNYELSFGISSLKQDKVFFLSVGEAENSAYGFISGYQWNNNPYLKVDSNKAYWLRSPSIIKEGDYEAVGFVSMAGNIDNMRVISDMHARPAMNLKAESVLFTSAAAAGRGKHVKGAENGLMPVVNSRNSDFELTLLDDGSTAAAGSGHKNFAASKQSYDGTDMVFTYSGAVTGEYISGIVTDSANMIKYYGRLGKANAASGTITFNAKGRFEDGDKFYVFNEDYNGVGKTHYASKLVQLSTDQTRYPVTGVSLNKKTLTLEMGGEEGLKQTITPSYVSNPAVTWMSDNTKVATVSPAGIVTAVNTGKARITVMTKDGGYTAHCDVTVVCSMKGTVKASDLVKKKVTTGTELTLAGDTVLELDTTLSIDRIYDTAHTLTIRGSGRLDAANGVFAKNITIESGEVNAKGGFLNGSLCANEQLTISGGTVKAEKGVFSLTEGGITIVAPAAILSPKNAGYQYAPPRFYYIADADGKAAQNVVIGTVSASAKWIKASNGKWWYKRADGTYPKSKWEKIDGKWYHFDAKGYMQTGWQKIGGKWYYLGTNGAMVTGWKQISGKWYYFNSSGAMQTGWQKISGKWYYFESSGVMLANTSKKIGKKTYTFDKNGVCTNP